MKYFLLLSLFICLFINKNYAQTDSILIDTMSRQFNTANSPLKTNNISDIKIAKDGTIWIATWGEGIYCKNGNTWKVYNESNSNLKTNLINCLYIDKKGDVWTGTNAKGAYVLRGQNWEAYNVSTGNLVLSIGEKNGKMLFGTFMEGMYEVDPITKTSTKVWKGKVEESNHVHKIIEGKNGEIVISTSIGLYKSAGNTYEPLLIPGIDTSVGVAYDLVKDSQGNLWAGLFPVGGLAKYNGKTWVVYEESFIQPGSSQTKEELSDMPLKQYFTHGMAIDENDNIYLATSQHSAISKFSNNQWKPVYKSNGTIPISSVVVYNDSLYAGTWFNGMINMYVQKDTLYHIKHSGSYEDRPIVYKDNSITITDTLAELYVFDNKISDGDIVSLSLNGEWILQRHEITTDAVKIPLRLHHGENIFVAYADSEGKQPPNTCSFLLKYDKGQKERTFSISSGMKNSGAIKIKVL